MFTIRPSVRRVFWKRSEMDISTIGWEPESKVDTNSVRRTFEVHFLAHHSVLGVKEKISHIIDNAFAQLSPQEIAHFKSITHSDANGKITHWVQNGKEIKRTKEILSGFTITTTK